MPNFFWDTLYLLKQSMHVKLFKVASILGGYWKENAASAFGIFKFVQSLASAISFFYSAYLGFHWQLLILTIFSVLGSFACVKVELITRR